MFGREKLKTNFWTSIKGFFYEKAEADKVMDEMMSRIKKLEKENKQLRQDLVVADTLLLHY